MVGQRVTFGMLAVIEWKGQLARAPKLAVRVFPSGPHFLLYEAFSSLKKAEDTSVPSARSG